MANTSIPNKPVITVKEARRLLGKDSKDLNDVEVMEIVNNLHVIAKEYLQKKSVNMSNNRLELDNGLPESKPK